MSKNILSDDGFSSMEDGKGQSKYILSKYEYDLFHDEDNVPGDTFHVKRIGDKKKGEKWKVFKNNKLALTIEGTKLTSKEKSFLYSAQGFTFLIEQFKAGFTSISSLKKNTKSLIK